MNSEKLRSAIRDINDLVKMKFGTRIQQLLEESSLGECHVLVGLLYSKVTLLFFAATINDASLVTFIVQKCDCPEDNDVSCNGVRISPFWAAVWNNSTEAAVALLPHEADINTRNRFAATALMKSLTEKKARMVKMLILNNVNLDVSNERGQTPLMLAMFNLRLVKEILKRGGNSLNDKDKEGNTVLHYALQHRDEGVLQFLSKKGLSTFTQNFNGKNGLDIAEESKNQHKGIALSLWGTNNECDAPHTDKDQNSNRKTPDKNKTQNSNRKTPDKNKTRDSKNGKPTAGFIDFLEPYGIGTVCMLTYSDILQICGHCPFLKKPLI
ncbi:hypothetical protein Ahia01_001384900 [Argonauta hians]